MTTVGSRHAVAPAASTAASRKPSSAGYRVAAVVALAGTLVATFEAAEPGQYTITSRYDPRGLAHLAVGENIGADFVQRMLGPVLLALLVAVVVALSTATGPSRH